MIRDLSDRGLVKANVVRTMDSTRYGDVRITSAGVEYLDESSRMRWAKQFLGKAFDATLRVAVAVGGAL